MKIKWPGPPPCPTNEDVTLFLKLDEPIEWMPEDEASPVDKSTVAALLRGKEDNPIDWEGDVVVEFDMTAAGRKQTANEPDLLTLSGRGHVGACYGLRRAALTVRGKWSPKGIEYKPTLHPDKFAGSSFEPPCLERSPSKPAQYFAGIEQVCQTVWRTLTPEKDTGFSDPLERGVIIVAGRTGTCKSLVARGLVHLALSESLGTEGAEWPKRNRHVVTFEDPIETALFSFGRHEPDGIDKCRSRAAACGIDFTPRVLGRDLVGTAEGFRGAKRQTPSIVYVGEVRSDGEWQAVLDFAEGGHLIVTTTHAGSIAECFQKLMGGAKDTPALRSRLGTLTRAVVHLRGELVPKETEKVNGLKQDFDIVVPSVWRRTPSGLASFVSSGFASLLPHFTGTRGEATSASEEIPRFSSIGRRWFACQLATMAKPVLTDIDKPDPVAPDLFDLLANFVERKATMWDLRGV